MTLEVVILAAGQGTRMHSDTPKVLHEVGGKPLLVHVLNTAKRLQASAVHVVYGYGGERVPECLQDNDLNWVVQGEQRGTAHALMQALPQVANDALVLVLFGDVPLISRETLTDLVNAASDGDLAILTAELDDPTSYGRIVRDGGGQVVRIVEEREASSDERALKEVNTGFLAAPANRLESWLASVDNKNAKGEYYLTDMVEVAVAQGSRIVTCRPRSMWEIRGINTRLELAQLERVYQQQRAQALMSEGVTLIDPARFDLRGDVNAGHDVLIDVNVVLEGEVFLGDGVRIGPNNIVRSSSIGAGTVIHANCVIEESVVGRNCQIGPFTRLRPGLQMADQVRIGNFVEIKKSEIDEGSKINHLSYVGDTKVGRNVNIGAGTITCNYDGAEKHQTVIGDNAFIGSDVQLVAPVKVGEGATIGAGSTITKDVPPGQLTVSRAEQRTRKGWKRPVKKSNK